jgi:hypothetical protein
MYGADVIVSSEEAWKAAPELGDCEARPASPAPVSRVARSRRARVQKAAPWTAAKPPASPHGDPFFRVSRVPRLLSS